MPHPLPPLLRGRCPALLLITFLGLILPATAQAQTCPRTVKADVVALDQVFFWNRLGAVQPQGMMFALRRDVCTESCSSGVCTERCGTQDLPPGKVYLRRDKRPRPLVLRMNAGDCLRVDFQNLLADPRVDDEQPATRQASFHGIGLQLVESILDDGSFVGRNQPSSLANVGDRRVYVLYAEREGEHVVVSNGVTNGGEGDGGSTNAGLFGAVVVEPKNARWYRSQLTRQELAWATVTTIPQTGQPQINYEATYPAGHPRAGQPILNMMMGANEIIHSDLTAIIVGSSPNSAEAATKPGWFPASTFPPNIYTYPEREQPFRELVIIYHDEIGAVQAFPQFEQDELEHTLHGGRDGFAINYGAAGIGSEILANRFRVGPMHDCDECKFEEFFLSSWAVGDPAMVVDKPANKPCMVETTDPNRVRQDPNFQLSADALRDGDPCTPLPNAKATKAFFPEDPSNVYHSYINDHTKFRVLHAGTKEHHIHHLHAHQWLFSADSDKSSYLDSQAIGPGASFTAEIAYHGGGNLNKTVGDAIFHCHFYPHFAQGMWALWRVHDVFEKGTILDENGRPQTGANRALPDGEIPRGTPIPAVVPLPGKPMAPMPEVAVSIVNGQAKVESGGNPGFPFFVPALAGHRPPHPPKDTVHTGGLPRHRIDDATFDELHTRLDFHKILLTAKATWLDENGEPVEKEAMEYHAIRRHPSCEPGGVCDSLSRPVKFITNGRPAAPGAPYADPCVDADGVAAGNPRYYKVADIQDDVRINKKAWHFFQQRFSALWHDVDDYLDPAFGLNKKPPEPLFFRAASRDCIEFWLTNLVPNEYELDDFQVRSPTDILGQHIHLVKFDVTASDGAANGFNYEDGSFAPEEVRERIKAIRAANGCSEPTDTRDGTTVCPRAQLHPFVPFQKEKWRGAQTTVQRWYADPVLDNQANDRTLRTVFTHDHFGPSTHQQAGLYAGLVIEPLGSTWFHNEEEFQLSTRNSPALNDDGGPTSWQAVIDAPAPEPDYREFLLEFGDFQLAYEAGATQFPNPDFAVNPPGREEVGLPDLLIRPELCPDEVNQPPCPEIISADDPGTMSINYRQEPVALRVVNPTNKTQAAGQAGDLSYAFSSSVTRVDPELNVQPGFYAPLTRDVRDKDPFTPLLRAYENDRVQVRILVGAHEEGHNFSIHGVKWLFEPSEPDSGFRNSQMMGISEHFEFIIPQLIKNPMGDAVDRLWSAGSSTDDYWNGIWGLLRAYTGTRKGLMPLPDNPHGGSGIDPGAQGAWDFSCPKNAPLRTFDISAVGGQTALPGGRLIYNSRTDGTFGPLFDPGAMLYVRTSDLDFSSGTAKLKAGAPVEPLILRARAGECIKLTLRNFLPAEIIDPPGFNTLPMLVERFNANDIWPSVEVGLHPQLLYYDVSRYDAANVGINNPQTVARNLSKTYEWYAGDARINPDGSVTPTPIEFGATNLISSDRIQHASKGAIGALIIEPAGALITEGCPDPPVAGCTRAVANITNPSPLPAQQASFREFVLVAQNDVNMRTDQKLPRLCPQEEPEPAPSASHAFAVENLGCMEDPEDTGQMAYNYRTEPLWKRMQHVPATPFEKTDELTDWYDVVSNSKVGGTDPKTPVFLAARGEPIRFRLLQPGGHSRNQVFALHGHVWDKQPYIQGSTRIGRNSFSFWEGAHMGLGPSNHFDAVIRNGAGGKFSVIGDYLYRDQVSIHFDKGLWGILRVE